MIRPFDALGVVVETLFDWASVAVFAGLMVLYLQRSMAEGEPKDKIWHYGPPAIGCAVANQVGNAGLKSQNIGLEVLAAVGLVAVIGYIFHILKPFAKD
jgi:hypothetical protein